MQLKNQIVGNYDEQYEQIRKLLNNESVTHTNASTCNMMYFPFIIFPEICLYRYIYELLITCLLLAIYLVS